MKTPKIRKLSSGMYFCQLRLNGVSIPVKAFTEKECKRQADLIKAEYRANKRIVRAIDGQYTLKSAMEKYIADNTNILSPSTLRGYTIIKDNRFTKYAEMPLDKINFQKMVNEEAKSKSPKTVKNAWGLVTASLNYVDFPLPKVNLPAVPESEQDFLDHEQIKTFIKAIKDTPVEIPALLALHSLRASELRHLNRSDITNDTIIVHGATVRGIDGMVDKKTNKNRTSTRNIPIIIPRLLEILPEEGKVVTMPPTNIERRIKTICRHNNLPEVSLHDLRRSFASLGAYLLWQPETICALGGWRKGSPIVHNIYIKVSNKAISEDVEKMKDYLK